MYEKFYGLRAKPFALSPDPAYLYLAKRHSHALTMLEYVFTEAFGFALITGEVGCGKTTVVQHFLNRLSADVNVAFITNTHLGFGALLPWVMESLGVECGQASASERYQRFCAHLKREYHAGRRNVVVIDEAQNLGAAGLEELRVLSNVNTGCELFLQTILVGQPELRTVLCLSALRQFAQRIAMDHHLEALQPEETRGYICHRLSVAGGRAELFSAASVELIHEASGGIPRLINIVCDTALVYGFAEERSSIDVDLVQQVISDRAAGGILPLKVAAAPSRRPAARGGRAVFRQTS
jgi:general secretion pathway protein A